MKNNYIVLYSDKKREDNIMIKSMFSNTIKIDVCWTDSDCDKYIKLIDKYIKEKELKQIIFAGFELGWDKLIQYIKSNYSNIIVKVICNTSEPLLYYDYERNNFFKMLELSKLNLIDIIAFLKKGQYEIYYKLGYKCYHLMQNFRLINNEEKIKKLNDKVNIGVYPLNYTWDKNIFNQLCIAKFIDNSIINYNNIDNRMKEFIDTMKIEGNPIKLKDIEVNEIINEICKNDIIVSCSFTDYFNPIFFISMELGIPCIIGNTTDLLCEEDKLYEYIVTESEDNPILNSTIVKKCMENKELVIKTYREWKKSYDIVAEKNIFEFINLSK